MPGFDKKGGAHPLCRLCPGGAAVVVQRCACTGVPAAQLRAAVAVWISQPLGLVRPDRRARPGPDLPGLARALPGRSPRRC